MDHLQGAYHAFIGSQGAQLPVFTAPIDAVLFLRIRTPISPFLQHAATILLQHAWSVECLLLTCKQLASSVESFPCNLQTYATGLLLIAVHWAFKYTIFILT